MCVLAEGQKAAQQVSLQLLSLEQFLVLCSPQSAVDASQMDANTGGCFAYGKIDQERKGDVQTSLQSGINYLLKS